MALVGKQIQRRAADHDVKLKAMRLLVAAKQVREVLGGVSFVLSDQKPQHGVSLFPKKPP